jgi:hypothetical protein
LKGTIVQHTQKGPQGPLGAIPNIANSASDRRAEKIQLAFAALQMTPPGVVLGDKLVEDEVYALRNAAAAYLRSQIEGPEEWFQQ